MELISLQSLPKININNTKYIIDKFNFKFSIRGNDYILNFISPEAFQNIEGYITRKESFSIATLKPSVAWYGGTFTPLKSIKDLKVISKNNSLTLCKILLEPEVIDLKNRETNTNIIKFLACDNNETNTIELVILKKIILH